MSVPFYAYLGFSAYFGGRLAYIPARALWTFASEMAQEGHGTASLLGYSAACATVPLGIGIGFYVGMHVLIFGLNSLLKQPNDSYVASKSSRE